MSKTWRDIARPIIAEVLNKNKCADEKTVRAVLREAYPFGERKYHPYKIWLSEIQIQLGKRRFGVKKQPVNPNQANMFEDPDLHTGGFDY
jgi:hypothetical protein